MTNNNHEKFQQCGNFTMPDGTELIGDLKLDGKNTELKVYATDRPIPWPEEDDIDSGWDIGDWLPKMQTGAHPFRQFVNAYNDELARLEELLPESAQS